MRKSAAVFLSIFLMLHSITGCSSEIHETQFLNADNPAQGELIWEERDEDDYGWLHQCASPADKEWLGGIGGGYTLEEIRSNDEIVFFCEDQATKISYPDPFSVVNADLEVDTFLAAKPDYTICSPIFRFKLALLAKEEAESVYSYAEVRKELGDSLGWMNDQILAKRIEMEADQYFYRYESDATQVYKTAASGKCNDVSIG